MAVGRIVAHVMSDTSGFSKGTRRAKQDVKSFDKSLSDSAKSVAKWGTAVASAAGLAFAAMVRKGLEAVDSQAKLARSVDASIGALEGLERAAKDSGVAAGQAAQAAQRLSISLGEARRGTGEAAKALDDLGLSAADLAAMDVDERFAAISDAMHNAGMTTDQMADALRRLGIRNREMVLLMQQGGDSIRDATEEMKGYGLAIDSVDAAMIENLNDQLDRAKDVMRGVTNQLAVHAAPAIQAIVNLFSDATKETNGFSDTSERLVQILVKGAGLVADALQGVRMVFTSLKIAYQAWITLVLKGFSLAATAVDDFVKDKIKRVNSFIDAINLLPNVNLGKLVERGGPSDFAWMIQQMAEDSRKAMHDLIGDLADQAADMPSDKINRAYQAALAQREELAKAHEEREKERLKRLADADAATQEKMLQKQRDADDARRRMEEEAELRRLGSNLERLEHYLRDEQERIEHAYAQRLAMIEELEASGFDVEKDYEQMRIDLHTKLQEELSRIHKEGEETRIDTVENSMASQVGIVVGSLATMTGRMRTANRSMFELNKMLGISSAIINAHVAITRSLAQENMVAAIATGIAAFGQVAAIASQTYGSKGSHSSGAQMGPMNSARSTSSTASGGPSAGTLTVSGIDPSQLYSGDALAQLVEGLLEHQRQGGRVILA